MEHEDIKMGTKTRAVGHKSVRTANKLLSKRIEEYERTRRMFALCGTLLAIAAVLVLAFAPPENELIAGIFGTVLLVMALGFVGVSVFKIKLPGIEVSGHEQSGRDR